MLNFLKNKLLSVARPNIATQKVDKNALLTTLNIAFDEFNNETVDDSLNRIIAETGKSRHEILEMILNDDEVEGCREDIESAIKAMPFTLWGDNLDEDTQNELIAWIMPHIKDFANLALLAKWNGHAIAEYIYTKDEQGRFVIDKILSREGELSHYRFLRDGRVVFTDVWSKEEIIDDNIKNIVLTHRASPTRPMGQMLIVKAYPAVLLRNKNWAYLGQFIVRYAQPYVVGKQSEYSFGEGLVGKIYRFVSGGATVIDSESDIEIHQLQSNGQAFEMGERMSNARIQKLLLGRVKTSDQTHGSRSANETDDKARIDRIGSYLELTKEAIQHAINAMIVVNAHFGAPLVSSGQVWFEWKNEKSVDKTRAERDKLYLDAGIITLTHDYFKDILGYEEHHFKIVEPTKPTTIQNLPLSLQLSDKGIPHQHDKSEVDKHAQIAQVKARLIESALGDSDGYDEFEKRLKLVNLNDEEFIKELAKQGMSEYLKGLLGVGHDR